MTYLEMVRNCPNRTEEQMWSSVAEVSSFLDELKESHPATTRKFLMRQYALMYGSHFTEQFARESVADMFHTANNGQRIEGEMIDPERAFAALIPTGDTNLYWDAYVAANAFFHDLARTSLSEEQILECAREFWFADDDFPEGTKIFWYISTM